MEAIKQKRQYFHQLLIRLGEVRHKAIIVESEFGVSSTSQLQEWQVNQLIKSAEVRLQQQGKRLKKTRDQEQRQLKNWRNKCLLVLNERGITATPKDWSAVNNELAKKQYQWVMPDNGIINRKGLFAFRTVDDLKILFKQLCAIRDNEKKAALRIKDLALKKLNTMAINFDATKEDRKLILEIAQRAASSLNVDTVETMMDITAVHLNDTPLRLNDLLNADDFNFSHDVLGIARTLDRDTGKLTQCFLPRFTQSEPIND